VTNSKENTGAMQKNRYFYFDNGRYGQGDEELRPLGTGEFLVKTRKSLVSVGTETACNTGKSGWNRGRHGYSNVGTVIESKVESFRPGDRVLGLMPHVDYYIGKPGGPCFHIPEGISDSDATFTVLGRVAMHAIERASIAVGQPVVAVGQGTMGQLAQQLSRRAGAGRVIAVDTAADRRELSQRLGADAGIPPDAKELEEQLAKAGQDSPAPVFIEATGSAVALKWVFEVAPVGSRIVITGAFTAEVSFNPSPLVLKELDILGAHQPKTPATRCLFYPYTIEYNTHYVLEQIRAGTLRVGELSDGTIRPDELIAFYDAARQDKPRLKQPIIDWTGEEQMQGKGD
jgi:NADPH:quinone reductase-like Zn-dependent oxidoreductase